MRRTEFQCQGDFGWQLTLYYNECSVQPWILKILVIQSRPGGAIPERQIQFVFPSNVTDTHDINYHLYVSGFQIISLAQTWLPDTDDYKSKLARFIPLFTLRVPHTQLPHPLERRFLAFSLVYIPLLFWCQAILPVVQDPLWTPAVSHPPDLVGLSVSCSGFLGHCLIWFFPSPPYCKSIHILPGPPAPALAWHLLLVSRYCCLSLRLLPKGDLKNQGCCFLLKISTDT